jgi:hypothetical protein
MSASPHQDSKSNKNLKLDGTTCRHLSKSCASRGEFNEYWNDTISRHISRVNYINRMHHKNKNSSRNVLFWAGTDYIWITVLNIRLYVC